MAYVLSASPGLYHLQGADAALMLPWGGDAEFNWASPDTQASVFASATTDGRVTTPQSVFSWG